MRYLSPAALCAGVLLLAGCSGQHPAVPGPQSADSQSPSASALDTLIGPALPLGEGLVSGAVALATLHVDPAALEAELAFPRELQTQGDLYLLSVRPFFRPGNIRVAGVRRSGPDSLEVDVTFQHPFAAPADLTPPATAAKRIDLHIFDVTAVLALEGSSTFFQTANPVTANIDVLTNADGYRRVGQLVNMAALGVTNANIFPYKLVGNIDTGSPQGNYNPTANGWTGNALLNPTGYDVFPQGGSSTVTFELNLAGGGPLNLNLVTLAKYMDPRETPNPKNKRLPVPGEPTSLQYILPEAAGDVQRMTVATTGDLQAGSSLEIMGVDVEILDWDHTATVAASFPNQANLNEIREDSSIASVQLSAPLLNPGGLFTGSAVISSGVLHTSSFAVNNTAAYSPAGNEMVPGLVRVSDSQDLTDPPNPLALDETLATVAALSSDRYQVVRIPVLTGNTPPDCPVYTSGNWALEATLGLPWSLDLDAANTPASDPHGIALYELDFDNDGIYETTAVAANGFDVPDFPLTHVYNVAVPQTIRLRITDNHPTTPQSQVCLLTVNVNTPVVPVPDPFPVPGGINSDMAGSTVTSTVTDHPDILVSKPTGEAYFLLRRGVAPLNWVVYKSTDSGTTWGIPASTVPEPFPQPLNVNNSATRGFGIGIMADGRPCFVGMDAGFDLTFKRAASEAGTLINWGPNTEGSEIETVGDWWTPTVLPHPTNVNRVYIFAKNNSTTLGVTPAGLPLWVSNDATSPNPTFVVAGQADTDGPTTVEWDPMAAIDSQGNVHCVWRSNSTSAQVIYRKWFDASQTWGPEENLSAGHPATFTNPDDTHIKLNAADEPAIAWCDAISANVGPLYMVKYNTGTGWTSPRLVNDTTYPNVNSLRKYVGIAFDASNRIHMCWREDGMIDGWDDTAVTIFSADGRRKLGSDVMVHPATSATVDYTNPRIEFMPLTGKMLVTAYANTAPTDGRIRYRLYSTP